jgi:hypothetical protein
MLLLFIQSKEEKQVLYEKLVRTIQCMTLWIMSRTNRGRYSRVQLYKIEPTSCYLFILDLFKYMI